MDELLSKLFLFGKEKKTFAKPKDSIIRMRGRPKGSRDTKQRIRRFSSVRMTSARPVTEDQVVHDKFDSKIQLDTEEKEKQQASIDCLSRGPSRQDKKHAEQLTAWHDSLRFSAEQDPFRDDWPHW